MNRTRVIETESGIQQETTVRDFNLMQRDFKDKGLLQTKNIIAYGITAGNVAELGPGPGYLGLEWLKATEHTKLTGIEISPEMIKMAKKNSREYGLAERASYINGNVLDIPLDDASFDGVFSNGSLHEWKNPYTVLSEAHRILKPGGKLFICDLKRTINPLLSGLMKSRVNGKSMKNGLISSIRAAYTKPELLRLCEWSLFEHWSVEGNPFGLILKAEK